MKKSIFFILIYLSILSLIPSLVKINAEKQKEITMNAIYEASYQFFEMYEFQLRSLVNNEITIESLNNFLYLNIGSKYEMKIISPTGALIYNEDSINFEISTMEMQSTIQRVINNPLNYFTDELIVANNKYIISVKKIEINNTKWSLMVIADMSMFFNTWNANNQETIIVLAVIWTIFFGLATFLILKSPYVFLGLKKSAINNDLFDEVINNNINAITFLINAESIIEAINNKFNETLKLETNDYIGKNINTIITDFNLNKLIHPSENKSEQNMEVYIDDKDGIKHYFFLTFIPYFTNLNMLQKAMVTLTDISVIKDSINQLGFEIKKNMVLTSIVSLIMQESDIKVITKLIIEESKSLINFDYGTVFVHKDDYLIPHFTDDPHLEEHFGSFKIKIGDGLTGFVAKTKKPQIVNDAANSSITVNVPNTEEINECIMSAPLINNSGKLLGVITVTRSNLVFFNELDLQILEILALHTANVFDKTELMNTIIEDEKRHNTLINESALSILIIYEQIITFCNDRFCELLKYNKKDLIGQNILDFMPDKDKTFFVSQLTTFTYIGRTEIFEYEFITSDNKDVFLEFSLSGITWDKKPSILISANDVTEKIELNKRLIQSQKLQSIGSLTSGIAHDFKNVLSSILGATELILSRTEAGNSIKDLAKAIKLSADRAVKLSQRLLGYSRKVEDDVTIFDVNNIVRETLEIISYTFEKNIELILELSKDPLHFEGDAVRIQQCIMNLCVNARDVMNDGGKLYVKTRCLLDIDEIKEIWENAENRKYTLIEITDTGCGIPEHIQRLLFEPFFTTKSKEKGTGLGLSTTKTIINEYNGHIFLKTKINVGTSFFIMLPWFEAPIEAIVSEFPLNKLKKHFILLVDDEEIVLEITKDLLEQLGSKVYATKDGYEALEIIKDNPHISVAIIDRMMPKMDGMELLKRLKIMKPEIKVILASGFFHDDMRKNFIEKGADECITKPFRLEQLSNLLKDI